MTTRNFRLLLPFLLCSYLLLAQSEPTVWQPEVDVNYQLNSDWNFNLGMSYRSMVDLEFDGVDDDFMSSHVQWDAAANYRTGFRSHAGLTAMYRINSLSGRNAKNEFRLSESYALDIALGKFSLGNRWQTDQRFRFTQTFFRFRYQLSIDFPWSGERLDPREFYSIFSTESLLTSASIIKPLWDQRFTAAIGYVFSKKWKFQLTLEHRAEAYNQASIQRFFVYTRVIYSLWAD